MKLEAREVDFYNLSALMKIKVTPAQENMVAPNAVTIAQFAYEPAGWVRGLWDGDTAIGLVAMITPSIKSPSMEEGDPTDAAYLWRLMIAADQQRKGYGHQAMEIVFQQTRDWGFDKLNTSVVKGDDTALPFYKAFGLIETGRDVDGEIELMGPVPAL